MLGISRSPTSLQSSTQKRTQLAVISGVSKLFWLSVTEFFYETCDFIFDLLELSVESLKSNHRSLVIWPQYFQSYYLPPVLPPFLVSFTVMTIDKLNDPNFEIGSMLPFLWSSVKPILSSSDSDLLKSRYLLLSLQWRRYQFPLWTLALLVD